MQGPGNVGNRAGAEAASLPPPPPAPTPSGTGRAPAPTPQPAGPCAWRPPPSRSPAPCPRAAPAPRPTPCWVSAAWLGERGMAASQCPAVPRSAALLSRAPTPPPPRPAPSAAVILGGGAGTRLYPLTKNRAKPAVPIGGAYRLVRQHLTFLGCSAAGACSVDFGGMRGSFVHYGSAHGGAGKGDDSRSCSGVAASGCAMLAFMPCHEPLRCPHLRASPCAPRFCRRPLETNTG